MSEGKYQLEQMREEELLRDAEEEKFFNARVWVSKKGRETPLGEMDKRYLENIIVMIEGGRAPLRSQWLSALREEFDKRLTLETEKKEEPDEIEEPPTGPLTVEEKMMRMFIAIHGF